MGNCQANDAAASVIQHPDGGIQRLYRPATAEEIMRNHPGHYVALIADGDPDAVRFTRVRLLKHKEMLLIGQSYRLISSQEVTEALKQRKCESIRKAQDALAMRQQNAGAEAVQESIEDETKFGGVRFGRQRQRGSQSWRPSLQSISEAGS